MSWDRDIQGDQERSAGVALLVISVDPLVHAGMGILVDRRHVLTCAHVVDDALGRPRGTARRPGRKNKVRVLFPLDDGTKPLNGFVCAWRPAGAKGIRDVAVVELDEEVPETTEIATVKIAPQLHGHGAWFYGYRPGALEGVQAEAKIMADVGGPTVQLDGVKMTGHFAEPGFSGAAVWDEDERGVVGMLVEVEGDSDRRVTYMIPARVLKRVWGRMPVAVPGTRSIKLQQAEVRARIGRLEKILELTPPGTAQGQIAEELGRLYGETNELEAIARDPAGTWDKTRRRIDREVARQSTRGNRTRPRRAAALARSLLIYQLPPSPEGLFHDRRAEAQVLNVFLKDPDKRLFMVEGRGGIGKTALVAQTLRDLDAGHLPEHGGPWRVDRIVSLIGGGTHRVTAPEIFSALFLCLPPRSARKASPLIHEQNLSAGTRMLGLLEKVRSLRIVVLLNNFETVVHPKTVSLRDGDAELDAALRALIDSPDPHEVKVILTTQAVPRDLALFHPERQSILGLQGLPIEAVAALLNNLDDDGSLGLRGAAPEVITQVHERTDGNPLALEFLVRLLRIRATTLKGFLRDTVNVLPGEIAEALVSGLFHWLDPTARMVMQALAVYRHPVTANAVDYLLEPYILGVDSAPVLERLFALRAARKEDPNGPDDPRVGVDRVKYYLHSIDSDYALGRIAGDEPEPTDPEGQPPFTLRSLSLRGAEYFRKIRKPREKWRTREDIGPQILEFHLRCSAGQFDQAAEMLLEIDRDYLLRWGFDGLVAQMHERLQRGLTDPRLRYQSGCRLGEAYLFNSRYDAAARTFEWVIDSAREMGDRRAEVHALSDLGDCQFWLGDYEAALRTLQSALELAAKVPRSDRRGARIRAHQGLGFCYSEIGRMAKAVEHGTAALAEARHLGRPVEESFQLGYLGLYRSYQGDYDKAIRLQHRGLALARAHRARRAEAYHLGFLADVYAMRGDGLEAIQWAEEARRIAREIDSPAIDCWSSCCMALALGLEGDWEGAHAASEVACRFDEPAMNLHSWSLRGLAAFRLGDQAGAQKAFSATIRYADEVIVRCARNWFALHAKGLAMSGLALAGGAPERLRDAVATYRKQRKVVSDPGIVDRAVRLLGLLAGGGPEGVIDPVIAAATGRPGGDQPRLPCQPTTTRRRRRGPS
jgi:tetratricopeptide (TPR) repeat protein